MATGSGETSGPTTEYPGRGGGWLGWGGRFLAGFTKKGLPGTFSDNPAQRETQARWSEKLKTPKPLPSTPNPSFIVPSQPPPIIAGVRASEAQTAKERRKRPKTSRRMSKNPLIEKQPRWWDPSSWPDDVSQAVYSSYADVIQGAASVGRRMPSTNTRARLQSRSAPRSKQAGLVGDLAKYTKSPTPAQPTRRAGPRTSSRLDTKPGEELEPAIAPARRATPTPQLDDLQPIEVPQRERYTDLEPITVPKRQKYGSGGGSRPGTTTERTRGSTTTAGGRVALPGRGTISLPGTGSSKVVVRVGSYSFDIEPLIRAATTRRPSSAPRKAAVGFASSPTVPSTAPTIEPDLGFAGFSPPRTRTDNCDCEGKKKKRKKERKLRTECRSGTYKQTARGVKYSPQRIVPCN